MGRGVEMEEAEGKLGGSEEGRMVELREQWKKGRVHSAGTQCGGLEAKVWLYSSSEKLSVTLWS